MLASFDRHEDGGMSDENMTVHSDTVTYKADGINPA